MGCALICDTEHDVRVSARMQLKELGFEAILECGDGDSAVQTACVNDLEIAIIDMAIRKRNRSNVAYEVSRISKCPVLLLTDCYDREVVNNARRIRAESILLKPFRGEDLKFAIEMACAHAEELAILKENATSLDEISQTTKILQKAKALLSRSEGLYPYEAFRLIRKIALNNKVSMRKIAESFILTERL